MKAYGQAIGPPVRRRALRRRSDKHERQAREAARRFLRGDRNVGRWLTPAAAAGVAVAESRGEPLPGALRKELERGFGADLSAVRVHRDAAAHSAAAGHHAAAFTSGRDVYFAHGEFDPGSEAGRERIAHEVAHVLQQTARRSSGDRPAATAATGAGPVQCDEDGDDKVPFLASDTQAFTELAARHGGRPEADPALRDLIALVKDQSGASLPRKQSSLLGNLLVEIARAGRFNPLAPTSTTTPPLPVTLTPVASGFLLDCLKVCGVEEYFEAAAGLLDADTTFSIRTAFGPRTEFREFLKEHRGKDWIAEAFKQEPLKRFWFSAFVNTVEQFVLNPWRPIQTLYGFAEAKKAALENIHGDQPGLLASDRVVMAFELLETYDRQRLAIMSGLERGVAQKLPNEPAVHRRLHYAFLLRTIADDQLAKPQPAFWSSMLRTVRGVAVRAEAFWLAVTRFQTTVADRLILADKDDPAELFADFVALERPFAEDDPLMAPLRRALASMGMPGGLFFLDAQGKAADVPTPQEYQNRIAALDRAIDFKGRLEKNLLLTIQQELVEVSRKGKLDSPRALALGWVLLWTANFAKVLSSYSAKKDNPAYADARLAHRHRVAREMRFIAQVARWRDILDLTTRIMRGRDSEGSYLAVPGEWEIEPDIPVARLPEGLADHPVGGMYGLRPKHLAHFFHGEFLESLSRTIETAVAKARRDPKEKLDVEALKRKVEALPRPWRCKPDYSAVFVERDEDRGTLSASKLIDASDKSKDELDRLAKVRGLGSDFKWLAVSTPQVRPEILAWIIPNFLSIITVLKNSEPFKSRMTTAGYQDLPEGEWLEKLITLLGATAAEDILKVIEARVEGQGALFAAALRQFTALRRRSIARDVAKDLDGYKNTFEYRQIPDRVVGKLWHFRGQVEPAIDGWPQQALLVLGSAPILDDKFPSARAAVRLPPHFHETLTDTLKFVDEARKATAPNASAADRAALPVDELLFRNDVDPTRSERIDDFLAHAPKIADLAKHMEEARTEIQEESGFGSADGVTLHSVRRPYERLTPGRQHAMEVHGDDWELVEVHQKFTYHPELSFSARTSATADPILKGPDGTPIPMDGRLLATFLVNGDEYEVRATDSVEGRWKLSALSEAIFWHVMAIEMGELADTLEAGAMLLVDILELIPGIGQAGMIGRLTASMIQFSAEIPALADALTKNPLEFVKTLASELMSKYLRLETIVLFFLLGEGDEPFADKRTPRPEPPTKSKPKGKLARALAILRRLGMRLADALRWVRLRVAGPVAALQSSIATRPQLGWLLQRAVDIAFWLRHALPADDPAAGTTKEQRTLAVLAELIPVGSEPREDATPEEVGTQARGLMARIEAEVTKQAEYFRAQLDEMLNHLAEGELPKEILPLDRVMEWMIDFFLSRLGAKVRIAKRLLQGTDVYQKFTGKIASALAGFVKGTDFDPNKVWETQILDKVDEQLLGARNDLVKGIYSRTNAVADATGIDFFRLPRPADKEPGKFGLQRTEYTEIEADMVHGAVPARGRLAELPATPGQPLAATVRVVEERRFGHDLRHVRLHAGAEAPPAVEGMGANALTSGSHVFFRPGLDPRSSPGARVLRHELTHVLQQAGPRPLGRMHETRPVRGRPGVGLTVDRLREAAAEVMATADAAAIAREPIEVNSGAEGVQPSFDAAVARVLERLTTYRSEADFQKETDAKTVPGEGDAKAAWAKVRERVKSGTFDHEPFVKNVVALLAAHVVASVDDTDIRGVAALAQAPARRARGKKPKNTKLDFERFVTLLEGFIVAKTGVAMQLELTGPKTPTLKKLHVTYVHFGAISPTSPTGAQLWDAVMKATPGLAGKGDEQKKVRLEIRARLHALGPEAFIWKPNGAEFRFSEEFVEAFNKVRATRKPELERDLPPVGPAPSADPQVQPPPKDEYLNPSGQKGIGLRIGVHKGQKATDRESHHTTQYLLVQYFQNHISTVKAWKSGVEYPGIPSTKRDNVGSFGTGSHPLHLAKLDPDSDRGAQMPAVLLSADLHKRGQLHVRRERQWTGGDEENPDGDPEQGGGSQRQGFAIEHVFKAALERKFGARDDTPEWDKAVKAKGKPGEGLVFDAMVATYHWMHDIMFRQLEAGLVTRELAYYRGIAARQYTKAGPESDLQSAYDLKVGDMLAVYERALASNNSVMSAAGWPAPTS